MRTSLVTALTAATLLLPVGAASAAEQPVDDLRTVPGLTAEQKAAVEAVEKGSGVAVGLAPKTLPGMESAVTGSRRATYYRGSFLMWARDSVDFGYNGRSVTWTSAYQQAGSVFPNIARNLGIRKYYDTSFNDKFRAANRIGAGVVTPWGDVTVYTSDYIHRLSVSGNGAWSAWSD
ncbi:hypothetical protein [Mobilicoccus caccae]|uniref:Uncharacterized protein n=1 Tax=Mobilicoccus caccae TaxID=1859295 RepID=A0ABQ6IQY0_9MICO|nr:hypothetical protein [Mobilicoccus caccae]GMA40106.1 hypothetical protein GCM10025883_21510 [Mobilicoccus caccae]